MLQKLSCIFSPRVASDKKRESIHTWIEYEMDRKHDSNVPTTLKERWEERKEIYVLHLRKSHKKYPKAITEKKETICLKRKK
jgi:hypothetical protein